MKESAQLSGAYNPLGAFLMQKKGSPGINRRLGPGGGGGTLSEKDRREQEGLDLPSLLLRLPGYKIPPLLREVAGKAERKWTRKKKKKDYLGRKDGGCGGR